MADGGRATTVPLLPRAAKGEMFPLHQAEQPQGCCNPFFGDMSCTWLQENLNVLLPLKRYRNTQLSPSTFQETLKNNSVFLWAQGGESVVGEVGSTSSFFSKLLVSNCTEQKEKS